MPQIRKTDWILFSAVLGMVLLGLVMVFSASSVMAQWKFKTSLYFFSRQAGWAAASLIALMLLKRMDYRRFKQPVYALSGLGVILILLIVAFIMDSHIHRWIRFGSVGLQPSELAKPVLAVFLAYFVSSRSEVLNHRRTLMQACVALGVLAGLVVLGDFGTALVLIATSAAVFYVAGLSPRYLAIGMAGLMVLGGISIVLKPYRLSRVIGYIDPEYKLLDQIDPAGHIKNYAQSSLSTRDTSYQVRQSKIAVGAGGATGVGLMQGKQKLLYLPEAHTDFVYAVVGEELGLWGCVLVLFGFAIVSWRGFRLFQYAPDQFGKYLALAITVSIALQALINISVVLGLGPTKGFPLPMISYGGSSLLGTLSSMGLLLSVSEHA